MTNSTLHGAEPYKQIQGEEYMSASMRKHFHLVLEAWKCELMSSVDQTVAKENVAADLNDPADRASQEEEFALELRNHDRARKLIKRIDKSMQRIADEDYGWCDSCGIAIGLHRLEARPVTDLCFDCTEVRERTEKSCVGHPGRVVDP